MIQSLLWGFPYWIYQNQREAPAFPKDASSHDFARGDKIAWRDAFSATKGVCSCDQRFKPNCLGTLIYLDALHESLLSVYIGIIDIHLLLYIYSATIIMLILPSGLPMNTIEVRG
jgi:hypothetical protein